MQSMDALLAYTRDTKLRIFVGHSQGLSQHPAPGHKTGAVLY